MPHKKTKPRTASCAGFFGISLGTLPRGPLELHQSDERGDPGVDTVAWGCGVSTEHGVGSPGFSLPLSTLVSLASRSSKPCFLIWNTRGILAMLHALELLHDAGLSSEGALGNKYVVVCFP